MTDKALEATIEKLQAKVAELEATATRSADILEIMNLHSRYIHWLETGNNHRIWPELWCHDDPRLRCELTDSGVYEGPESVRRLWESMAAEMTDTSGRGNWDPRGTLATLFIATPLIVVSKDGKTAKGAAHVFGPHSMNVTPYPGDEHKLTAYWFFGKYDNEYIKVDGKWKFLSIKAMVIFRSPYDQGWLRQPECRQFPPPKGALPDKPPSVQTKYNPDGVLRLPSPPEEDF